MSVDEIILWVMAAFMALGALDRVFGSRVGLGKQFEEGILAIGALSLSMLGILTLAPVLARLLRPVLVPVYGFLGADPAMVRRFDPGERHGRRAAGNGAGPESGGRTVRRFDRGLHAWSHRGV